MANGQQQPQEPVKVVIKDELESQKTKLHNMRFSIQIQEAVVKKLEELAR